MKRAVRFCLILAVCSALALPGVALADRPEFVGELKVGPGVKNKNFGIERGSKFLAVSILNGSGGSKEKVSSARVIINDVEIFSPRDFDAGKSASGKNMDKKVSSIMRPHMVNPDTNVLEVRVEVKGKKGSEVSVKIDAIYEDTEPPVELVPFYFDADGDQYGDMNNTMIGDLNNPPDGPWVLQGGDCNDFDPTVIYPGDPGCLF